MGSFILVHVFNKTYLQSEGLWEGYQATIITILIVALFANLLVIFAIYVLTTTRTLHTNFLCLVYIFGLQYIFSTAAQGILSFMQFSAEDTG